MAKETLSGKITVVTGGARGIGYAVAERLLEEGAKVAFCALRQESVDDAAGRLRSKGEVLGVAADVSKYDEVKRFIAAVLREFGRIDILVNNAGIRTYKSVLELQPEEWDRMLGVNLSAAFYFSHEVLPIFRQQGGGDIVNISSLSSTSAFAGGAGYNASKAGLNGLSDATMLDHRYDGVRVSEVMPGSTDTEFNGPKTSGNEASSAAWKVAPADIAEAVVLLLQMPRRSTVSRIDVKPTRPLRKHQ
jgi:NAD(P)-dependent dehydrogenase (short-subunit alcohol dehydrogenase family)